MNILLSTLSICIKIVHVFIDYLQSFRARFLKSIPVSLTNDNWLMASQFAFSKIHSVSKNNFIIKLLFAFINSMYSINALNNNIYDFYFFKEIVTGNETLCSS